MLPDIYAAYQEHLNEHKQMDFDDQLVFAHRILRRHQGTLSYFQNRYPYLCVDEAQDTLKIQHAILRLLAAPQNNIFMVGDEDQSIYGFRAAWPQALLEFEHTYSGAKVLLMETNYRSTAAIVNRANNFIQRNQSRRPKHTLTAIAGSIAEGYYGVPAELKAECQTRLPEPLLKMLVQFKEYLETHQTVPNMESEGGIL